MKSNQKNKKKTSAKRIKKTIFSLIVILIVLSFAASFFASGISTNRASTAQATADATPVPEMVLQPSASLAPTPIPTPDENLIQFMAAIKESMVASEEPVKNATLIVGAINVYNTLYQDDMIIVDKTADAAAIEKLKSADIYFDEITEDMEVQAWELITVDENGKASVN